MAGAPKGTYTEELGYKKIRQPAVTYWSALHDADVSFDPASVAAGAGAVSSNLTVPGAKVGDRVDVFPPYSLQGVMVFGNVTADDTVVLSLHNPTSGAVDLPAGTWRLIAVRP